MSDANFRAGITRAYRDHIISQLGWKIPNVTSGAELIALAQKVADPPFEAEHGLRTEPPFPGAAEKPDEMPTGWRMICASRLYSGDQEVGVIYLTFVSGRTPSVVFNAPGTLIPKEYLPVISR